MENSWFSNMPGFNNPSYWNYENEKLASLLGKLDIKPIEAGISLYSAIAEGIKFTEQEMIVDAISAISSGGMHGAVYDKLEAANRRTKQEKMQLWENQDGFY